MTHIRGLITPLIATHEPPSTTLTLRGGESFSARWAEARGHLRYLLREPLRRDHSAGLVWVPK